ncbi:MAG: hypothetical protein HYY23_15285 [Verrucomicrobia bacterium]|nr:hypothetical protein [Verrucomicrobiota bacterium]
MIRRLNYTGRIKIRRGDVRLTTREVDGVWAFDADLRLKDYELPADALVFVEAYRQTSWMRFPFGTVAAIHAPPLEKRRLIEFDSVEGIRFRVKVTQPHDEHILLAAADRIPLGEPEDDANKESLLPVVPFELGDELWQVDLDDEPRLLVNKSASADWRLMALSPVFVSLVYPAVLREVLRSVLASGHRDTEDDSEWRSKWLRFATLLPGVDPEPPSEDDGEDAALRWVNDAVAAFAKKLALKEKFFAAWHLKEGG